VRADIAVVGGGPAGAAAAIALAGAGRQVVVVDRARFPRDKTCGDGLTAAALRQLEGLGVEPRRLPSWQEIGAVRLRSPGGRTGCFPLPGNGGVFAAVVSRHDLDAALLDRARAAGADVRDGHALRSARRRDDEIVLGVDGLGEVRAPYVVGADGMWSPLRKVLGAAEPGYLGEWHAFRQYVQPSGPAARHLWVWFDRDLLPGYAWSFPLGDGRVNVGLGIRREQGQPVGSMAALWRGLFARPHVRAVLGEDFEPVGPHAAWPIPARVDRSQLAAGRALFAGDAARVVDPMSGEGIAQALVTGRLAAEAILAAGPHRPEEAGAHYTAAVRDALLADHRLAATLSALLARPWAAEASLRLAGSTDWTRRNFARWLFEDYPRAAVATPRRWPTLRARSGAYTG
jgi:geranylgeranyl reductase family protein